MWVFEKVSIDCESVTEPPRSASVHDLHLAIGPLETAQDAYAREHLKQPTGIPVPRGVDGVYERLPLIFRFSSVEKKMEKVCSIDPLSSQDASHTASLSSPSVGNRVAFVKALNTFTALDLRLWADVVHSLLMHTCVCTPS